MPASLDLLPFDLICLIVSRLDLHDYLHLSQVNQRCGRLLREEILAKKVLQTLLPFSREAQLLPNFSSGSFQALERLHNIQESVAYARPYSISVLAYGETFCYAEGFLCYLDRRLVRILDVHSSSRNEKVIDVDSIKARHDGSLSSPTFQVVTLSYSDGVLVCVCEEERTQTSSLLVMDVGFEDTGENSVATRTPKASFRHELACITGLFVRHNRSYLYYGTRSGSRSDGHHEWLITGLDLATGREITTRPVQLTDFVGSEIGSTVCFQIQGGDFIALSNQTSFEVEEDYWTSFYTCVRVPLGTAEPVLKTHVLWRREHREGPIKWTNLSLQRDQRTNELLIVECRKEWLGGSSTSIRTCYTRPLDISEDDETLQKYDSNSIQRRRRHCHREHEPSKPDLQSTTPPHEYVLARSKLQWYNSSAISFVDLVSSDPAKRRRDRLRLRIASRRQRSPLVDDPANLGQSVLRKAQQDENDNFLEHSEEDFHPTEVRFWPPDDVPTEIYDILCPSGQACNVEAVADDRSIIYMTDPSAGTPDRKGTIVMISFDPIWKYPGLRKLDILPSSGLAPCGPKNLPSPPRLGSKRALSSPGRGVLSSLSAQEARNKKPKREGGGDQERMQSWQDRAMYLSIDLGYRFRCAPCAA